MKVLVGKLSRVNGRAKDVKFDHASHLFLAGMGMKVYGGKAEWESWQGPRSTLLRLPKSPATNSHSLSLCTLHDLNY